MRKSFEDCKQEVASRVSYQNFHKLVRNLPQKSVDDLYNAAANLFATECIKECLSETLQNEIKEK